MSGLRLDASPSHSMGWVTDLFGSTWQHLPRTTFSTAAEESKRVAFNVKVRLVTNSCELINRKTYIYFHDAMTANTGQVMVMMIGATNSIVMAAIGKLDTIEQTRVDHHLPRTIDRCPPQVWLSFS